MMFIGSFSSVLNMLKYTFFYSLNSLCSRLLRVELRQDVDRPLSEIDGEMRFNDPSAQCEKMRFNDQIFNFCFIVTLIRLVPTSAQYSINHYCP